MTNNDLTGKLLGQYEIIEKTAVGGMANVYRARQQAMGRDVAIKVISNQLADQAGFAARFEREAHIVARLEHPNILPVYDYGTQDGVTYLAMRLMSGGTLTDLIAKGPLPLDQSYHILQQIGDALGYAHTLGIVHRDLKPSNILFDSRGNAYLSDFGIAKTIGETASAMTASGASVGTPAYISPEAAMGSPVDGRSDLYALGLILYEMLTGQKPFTGETPISLIMQQIQAPTPSARAIRPELPEGLDAIITRALAKSPADRYQTASELVIAFGDVLTASGINLNAARYVPSAVPSPAAPISEDVPLSKTMYPSAPSVYMPTAAPRRSSTPLLWIAALVVIAVVIMLVLLNTTTNSPTNVIPTTNSTQVIVISVGLLALIVIAGVALFGGVSILKRPPVSVDTPIPPTKVSTMPSVDTASSSLAAPSVGDRTIIENVIPSAVPPPPPVTEAEVVPKQEDATSFFPSMSESTLPDVQITVMYSDDQMQVGKTFKVAHVPFTIGRADADLTIKDKGVSRLHVSLDYQDGTFYAKDEGSANGTYINGKKLTDRVPLMFGNVLQLGASTKLTFVYGKPTTLPDLTGQQITPRYRLEELLKTSGKTVVYRAFDETLEIDVAVKVLSPELATFAGYAAQFNREAKTASKLQHPHIVKIKDFGTAQLTATGKISYIVMELLTGGTLIERLQDTDDKPTLEQIASWVEKIADALDYAHRHGVIHGGLKPTAIVFNSDDIPFVTDFAIASKADSLDNHVVVGAPAFLAPEQWENAPITVAVDQFALAALTYLMVTGMRPFEGQENPDVRRSNFMLGARPAHQAAALAGNKDVPISISEVIAKGLSSEPSDRYESTLEFAHAFKDALTRKRRTAQPRIFISYQRDASAGWAVLFSRELREKHNIHAFVDTERLDSAMQFPLRLKRAIEDSDVFVCLLAEPTLKSKWVQEEIRLAHEFNKPMLPVIQESFVHPAADATLESHIEALIMYDGVQLLDRKNIFVDETIAKLARMILATVDEGAKH